MCFHIFTIIHQYFILFAARALSGVFLAEQIRQQQLTAALESRLNPSSFSAIQTALLMNKLKAGAGVVPTSVSTTSAATVEKTKGRGGRGSRGGGKSANASHGKDKKNTVASLLAKSRQDGSAPEPELTIEPIYRRPSAGGDDGRFDTSAEGRRFDSVMDADGKLKIKTVSDSPEIRNLSDEEVAAAAAAAADGGVYNPDDLDGSAAATLAATKLLELSNSHPIPYASLISSGSATTTNSCPVLTAESSNLVAAVAPTTANPANNNNASSTSKLTMSFSSWFGVGFIFLLNCCFHRRQFFLLLTSSIQANLFVSR